MKKRIKNRLAQILEAKNITPYRLAKNLGVPAPTVYNWVDNKTNPSQAYLVELLSMLGTNLEEFYEVLYE